MESDKKHRTEVKIFGEHYTLKSSKEPEYMQKVAVTVDETMNHIAENKPRLSLHQIAVLAAVNLADEYLKLEEEYYNLMELVDEEIDSKKG
ncbi:cell division protein ZapA [Natranaerobius trueperi]|uniref:Cell division protein ZapA n=1 Tax=Natranaerobius trueperi TaxID=759412 RepID=A0A226BXJ8_9FIRM|nr:cell division protein ZapA [Natranaerobius trueperi]OWZ82870.1 cell division protein ZapA [Natranaerobius trueperi]